MDVNKDNGEPNIKKDGIKVLAVIMLLTIINVLLPFLSILILFIWPLPVVYMCIKHGMKAAMIVIAVASIINGFLLSPLMGLITIAGFGLIGFVLGGSIIEDFTPVKTLLATIAAVLFSQGIIIVISYYNLGITYDSIIQDMMQFISQNPELASYQEMIKMQANLLTEIFPAITVISSIIMGIIHYYFTFWFFNKRGYQLKVYKGLKYWWFPKWFVSLGIVIFLIFNKYPVSNNLNIILLFLAFVQGFVVGLYFLDKKFDYAFVKGIYVVLIMFVPLLPVILILLGLVDMWFDLRKIREGNVG